MGSAKLESQPLVAILDAPIHSGRAGVRSLVSIDVVGSYLMVGALLVATAFLVDPAGSYLGAADIPVLKYLPIILACGSLLLFAPGHVGSLRIPAKLLFLTIFLVLVLSGSLYTVLVLHHSPEDSLLGRGLGVLVIFPAYLAARRPRAWPIVSRWFWRCCLGSGIVITIGLVVWAAGVRFVAQPHIYHEEVFVPVAVGVALFGKRKRSAGATVLAFVLLMAGILSIKNTGFIVTAAGGALVAYMLWHKRGSRGGVRLLRRYFVVQSILMFVGAAAAVKIFLAEFLPTGSPGVRIPTYTSMADRFLGSPVFGEWFIGGARLELGPRIIVGHSDVLEVLAFGGILGAILLFKPLFGLFRNVPRAVRTAMFLGHHPAWSCAWAIVPLFFLEMLFNPVWHQPQLAFFFWSAVGFAIADQRARLYGNAVELSDVRRNHD